MVDQNTFVIDWILRKKDWGSLLYSLENLSLFWASCFYLNYKSLLHKQGPKFLVNMNLLAILTKKISIVPLESKIKHSKHRMQNVKQTVHVYKSNMKAK